MENAKVIKLIGKALGVDKERTLEVLNTFCIRDSKITLTNLHTTVTLATRESGSGPGIINFKLFDKSGDINVSKTDIPLSDFPKFPELKEWDKTGEINPDIINDTDLSIYKQTVSTDATRACLQGVSISEKGICSTDGHRAVYNKSLTADCDVILSTECIGVIEILKSAGEMFKKVSIFANKYIYLESTYSAVISRLIEGPYPDWHKIIPKKICSSVEVEGEMQWVERPLKKSAVSCENIQIIKNSLRKILPFVCPGTKNEKTYRVIFYNDLIVAKNTETAKHVKIKLPFQVFDQPMSFSCKYLIGILDNIKTDCIIQYGTGISAVMFNDTFLIMPLRVIVEDGEPEQWNEYTDLGLPAIKTAFKKAELSAYYLFSLQSLFGITKDKNRPGVVKQLSETEYKTLTKLGVSVVTEMETADELI